MKAISVRQPRAEQIVSGAKRMDIRSWRVAHRGALAIHASSTRSDDEVVALGLDPAALSYGVVVGVVDLVEVVWLDQETYIESRPEHLDESPFPGEPCWGWRFAQPQQIAQPVLFRGRMSLFDVPDELLYAPAAEHEEKPKVEQAASLRAGQHTARYVVDPPPAPDPQRPFVLYTLPDERSVYRVALYQWLRQAQPASTSVSNGSGGRQEQSLAPGAIWGIELGGDALRSVTEHLLTALRTNQYKATDLASRLNTPFYLDELSGLRLALIFLTVKPLSRYDRIEAIGQGIQAMSDEEAYYWFSKCSAGAGATRAQKALRVLLSDE